jgi:hypothetical protein
VFPPFGALTGEMTRNENRSGRRDRAARRTPRTYAALIVAPCLGLGLGAALLSTHIAGCSRATKPTAPGLSDKMGPGWTEDAGVDSAPAVASVALKPPPRFRVEEGCARDFKASGEAGRDLAELERLCAQGLAPILAATENTRTSGADPLEVPFRVTGSTACLRAGALGLAPGQLLSIEGARGVLASAVATETIAVVPVDGTVCVREPGAYRFVVRAGTAPTSDARTLSVQVWQASRD